MWYIPNVEWTVEFAFDPRRVAILLIGGDKTGGDRWYETYVPLADRLYDECLQELDEREKRHAADQKLQDTTEEDDT